MDYITSLYKVCRNPLQTDNENLIHGLHERVGIYGVLFTNIAFDNAKKTSRVNLKITDSLK